MTGGKGLSDWYNPAFMVTRPSRLYLPKFSNAPRTVFEYLLARFPHIPADAWRARVAEGRVTLSDGATLEENSPYRHGLMVFYRKEVASEPQCDEEPLIAYQDDEILVADKPHGMPVTPSGQEVERSLLIRLQRMTGLTDLSPVHRLDRDTAGLVLFTIKSDARGHYHQMFADGRVQREYFAVAHLPVLLQESRWHIENRIEPGEPWYRQRIVEGRINAITDIEIVDSDKGVGRFRLFPKTGKKHQLRVHMTSIGCPIVGDVFYPVIRGKEPPLPPPCQEGDRADPPLQLLARRLAFVDPLTGASHSFTSTRMLSEVS